MWSSSDTTYITILWVLLVRIYLSNHRGAPLNNQPPAKSSPWSSQRWWTISRHHNLLICPPRTISLNAISATMICWWPMIAECRRRKPKTTPNRNITSRSHPVAIADHHHHQNELMVSIICIGYLYIHDEYTFYVYGLFCRRGKSDKWSRLFWCRCWLCWAHSVYMIFTRRKTKSK